MANTGKLCKKSINPLQDEACFNELLQAIVNELDEIVYVSDIKTYDLLFLNEYGKKLFNIEDAFGRKCYEALQGRDSPCSYCTNEHLVCDSFYVWEWTNPITSRHYILKDKLIKWNNRLVRFEIAMDITEKESLSRKTRRKLEIERTLVECVRILGQEEDLSRAVEMVLANLGVFHKADRAYIFEAVELKDGSMGFGNTYEWCALGVTSRKENLQNVPVAFMGAWTACFERNENVIITDIESIREERPLEYGLLKPQGIRSLICVPLVLKGAVTGFIGVDNPSSNREDFSLLESLAFFVTNEQSKRNMACRLRELSFRDSLTGLNNRNSYMHALAQMTGAPPESLGVVFADLNGLKKVNDEQGHAAGDAFLNGIGAIFRRHFRKEDVFRIGGDEFVALCRAIPREKFLAKVKRFQADADLGYPGALALGAVWNQGNIEIMDMVRRADALMYEHKRLCHERKRD